MKGADSAKGEMHEEIVKCEREIKDYGGEYKAQGLRRKCKCSGGKQKVQIVLRGEMKCMIVKMKFEREKQMITGENERHKS